MEYKSVEEFKEELKKAIHTQDIEKFGDMTLDGAGCGEPFGVGCDLCPLCEPEGPKELVEPFNSCLLGSIVDISWDHYNGSLDEKTALARLILLGTKLLAYLDSKE